MTVRPSERGESPPPIGGGFFVEEFFPALLNQATNTMNHRFKAAVKRFGLSVSQWRTLAALTVRDDLSLTEVAELTSLGQPTLSRVVDQLADRELISTVPRRTDGRFVAISLTPSGRAVVAQVWPIAWQHCERALAALEPSEAEQLCRLLRRVVVGLRGE